MKERPADRALMDRGYVITGMYENEISFELSDLPIDRLQKRILVKPGEIVMWTRGGGRAIVRRPQAWPAWIAAPCSNR